MARRAIASKPELEVAEAFGSCSPGARSRLLELRELILATAATTPGVGELHETLKWGQPSYLTKESGSGTTIRLGTVDDETCAVFVHCQTNLVSRFRRKYSSQFRFEGNRAVLVPARGRLAVTALKDIIAMALTYHASKKGRQEPARKETK